MQQQQGSFAGSILMLSLHGYVGAQPELGKPDTGGQVVYVLELAQRFARLGRRVDLVTRRFEDQPEQDVVNDNFRVVRVPYGGPGFVRKEDMHDHLSEFVTNFFVAQRSGGPAYDIVYSHYWDAGWAGQKIADELGIPHIHTPHSLGWWKRHNMQVDMPPEKMESKYRFEERVRAEFLVYQSCDHVIATTIPQNELLRDQYDVLDRHISVIPPGLDENRFSPVRHKDQERLREQYSLTEHDVLVVGRMATNKGYDLLIHAMPTFLDLVPDGRLIAAVGSDGSKRDEAGIQQLKELAEEVGVSAHIDWRPYIADEDLPNYYRAATVYAMPSRYEPFGMVAIEAMACGTPTIVTVHGGLFELIQFGNNALYADPFRPVEFGAMLALPMQYPSLALELSVQGARFARRSFGWTGIARRIAAVFDGAVGARLASREAAP